MLGMGAATFGDKMDDDFDGGKEAGAAWLFAPDAIKRGYISNTRNFRELGRKAKEEAPGQPREQFAETAYWNPSVVTGKDGKATVKFKAPMALSEYRFSARGVTGSDTLVGQATSALTVKKDFFVDLKVPATLAQGDKPRFSAEVHHVGIKGSVEVRLAIYSGEREQVDPKTFEAKGDGVDEIRFDPFEVPDGESVRLTLTAKAGDKSDEVILEVPIRPWGVQAFASARARRATTRRSSSACRPAELTRAPRCGSTWRRHSAGS